MKRARLSPDILPPGNCLSATAIFLCVAVDIGLRRERQYVGHSCPIFLAGVITFVTISAILSVFFTLPRHLR